MWWRLNDVNNKPALFTNYSKKCLIPDSLLICQRNDLYSTASDPRPQMIPRPQVIPKMDRKWSSTASDPQSRPEMIPKEK